MDAEIKIVGFERCFQPGVDHLLESIQNEYTGNIYAPDSPKMKDVASIPGRKYWVALHGDTVIGTVGLIELSNNNVALKSMMLHKDYRGRALRVANKLLTVVLDHARAAGAETMYLGTMAQFVAAQVFYKKHSYAEIAKGDLPGDFVCNPVDVVFFKYGL